MKKLLFVVNPKAGKTAIKDSLFEIIEIFSNEGYDVLVYPTKGPNDASRIVIERGNQYDLIVCAGGDGTLDNIVEGYMQMDKVVPLGYIPSGSTNDFARSIKISKNPIEAAKSIMNGSIKYVDVGKFGETHFVYVAAFGIFTNVSYQTPQNLKNIMGHIAYILEGIKNITNVDSYDIEAQFDGSVVSGEYIFGMITNTLSVGGFRALGTKYMEFDDGMFECLLVRKPQNIADLQKVITSLLTGRIDEDNFFTIKASKVQIKSLKEISWTLDGEFGGVAKEVEIHNLKRVLPIIVDEKLNVIEEEKQENV